MNIESDDVRASRQRERGPDPVTPGVNTAVDLDDDLDTGFLVGAAEGLRQKAGDTLWFCGAPSPPGPLGIGDEKHTAQTLVPDVVDEEAHVSGVPVRHAEDSHHAVHDVLGGEAGGIE
ncbi:hypothetical protein ACWEO4_25925 [Streptomyces sp. NPDC004393]|uniref:hypothetical protein n=1 Tax=Streptomyces sp. NPDC004533 TaxID=3154278 RepID=UPI0033BB5BEB